MVQLEAVNVNANQIKSFPSANGIRLNKSLAIPTWFEALRERGCTVYF